MVTGKTLFETEFFGGNGYQTMEIITYHSLTQGFISSNLKATEGKFTRKRTQEIFNTGVTTVSTYRIQAIVGFAVVDCGFGVFPLRFSPPWPL